MLVVVFHESLDMLFIFGSRVVTEICARELIIVFGKLLLADVVYCDFKVNVVSG